MENLISIELTYDEWNKVLYGLHCAEYLSINEQERKDYKEIHEEIYSQMKLSIYEQIKKESH